MNNNEYQPNSHKFRENRDGTPVEKKHVEKVIRGTARVKKKSEINKLADIFISEDIKNVKSYVFMDVLVPAIKKAISDIVTDGIDMILYGGTGRSSKTSSASKISYRNFYDRKDDHRYSSENKTRVGYSYDDVTLDSRSEAEDVLARMDELIEMYGVVYVADLYDLVGVSGSYTDNKYGWINIRNAEIVRARDGGYKLRLPKAVLIT